MPRVRVVSRNFMEMVAALPAAKLDLLYDRHWTCQAVFRSLPPLAKQYVLRLLWVENAVPLKSWQEWARPEALSKHQIAIDRLEQLRVILPERKKEVCYRMNPKLQKQLRQALSTGGGPPRDVVSESVAARVPNSADLENYAMKQWESVLLQLVDCAADGPAGPKNPFIIKVFQRSGLLTPSSRPMNWLIHGSNRLNTALQRERVAFTHRPGLPIPADGHQFATVAACAGVCYVI